jgi:CheY-like chemotaxis protein
MPAAPSTDPRATILVVDDTPQNLSLMSDLLEAHYSVRLAPSGVRALKIVATHPPDLILLDIMMPEMDGYEVCRALKANPETRDIPVIFLTAMDSMEDEEKGLLAGAVDYITKPISPPILLARARNQLALKAAADKLREQNLQLEQERVRTRELLFRLKEATDKLLEQNRQLKQEKARASGEAPHAPPADAAAGRLTLGRYQINRELGKGAMGVVYMGTDPKIGRVVAIKTMALAKESGAAQLKEIKERFFREAESAGRLTHPNIVAIYDVGEERDLAYIAMEFLKGEDLSPYTRPGSLLPIDKVLLIATQVAEALAYAHGNGVIHRDIKPANIVYEPDSGNVKVTDFGIASITSSAAADAGAVLGTPYYLSPEQVAGKPVDGRADLFSLGVMIYLLVSGHLPFQGESLAQLMFRIAHEAHADVRTHDAEIPDCVATLINNALSKDPGQRYPDGTQMAKALSQCRRSLMVFAT